MMRSVHKKYGNDIDKFKQGLRNTSNELIEVLSGSIMKVVKNSEILLREPGFKRIMVYSYSKSISLSLKKLAKTLEDSL
jgi:hypothetical protein